jgi:hypothetical protein
MLLKPNTDTTAGTIVGPDGAVINKPTITLTLDEAELLRRYKKFLHARGLREALYCNECWDRDLSDGCNAFVRDDAILIECRCKMRWFQGQTY